MRTIYRKERSFFLVIREFLKALGEARTYSVRRNSYCIFGILWGLPIPLVTLGISLHASGAPLTVAGIMQELSAHHYHYFFLLHPVFFGIVFGAMGTIRHNKQEMIEEFEKDLLSQNAALEAANTKLKELDRLKSEFLSMTSHELHTPLTAIQGHLSFILSGKSGALNQTQRECLEVAASASDLLHKLIGELLDLSKIESGQFRIYCKDVSIAEVVDSAIATLKLEAEKNGIILERHLPEGLPSIRADRERLLQVLNNLIENAIKFNRKGGKVSITAHAEENGRLVFCVADTGIGIPADKVGQIFDKFYQIDSSNRRKYGGCGLGLAITKRIVEMHGGKIWVESAVDSGSNFFVQLQSKGCGGA